MTRHPSDVRRDLRGALKAGRKAKWLLGAGGNREEGSILLCDAFMILGRGIPIAENLSGSWRRVYKALHSVRKGAL